MLANHGQCPMVLVASVYSFVPERWTRFLPHFRQGTPLQRHVTVIDAVGSGANAGCPSSQLRYFASVVPLNSPQSGQRSKPGGIAMCSSLLDPIGCDEGRDGECGPIERPDRESDAMIGHMANLCSRPSRIVSGFGTVAFNSVAGRVKGAGPHRRHS